MTVNNNNQQYYCVIITIIGINHKQFPSNIDKYYYMYILHSEENKSSCYYELPDVLWLF